MEPETWPEAGSTPYHNIIGSDPLLRDPENGDYRPQSGSPAEEYGCQTFAVTPIALGTIRADQRIAREIIWDADTVLVSQDILIDKDATLTIAPGTRVVFQQFKRMEVQGCLLAVGTPDRPIVFTAEHPELFTQDHGQAGAWNGLVFPNTLATEDTSRLHHCVIEYSKGVPEMLRDGTIHPGAGGALRVANFSRLEVLCCVFRNNLADFGGAVYCCYGAAPVLAGNLLIGNRALEQGSAIFNAYAYPRLINNTITGNIVESGLMFLDTGAVDNFHSKPLLVNNIIQFNHTDQYADLQVWEAKEYYATCNNIGGLSGGVGNMDQDPLFDGEGELPGILTAASPCIDTGDGELALGYLPEIDLLGMPRISGQGIDMGAFELPGVTEIPGVGSPQSMLNLASYPNPFNPRVTLSFELARASQVHAEILDVQGRRITVLLHQSLPPGSHDLIWNGSDHHGRELPSGVYLGRVSTSGTTATDKLLLVR